MDDEDEKKLLGYAVDEQIRTPTQFLSRKVIVEAIVETHPDLDALIRAIKKRAGDVDTEALQSVGKNVDPKIAGMLRASIQQRVDGELNILIKAFELFRPKPSAEGDTK